MNRDYRSKRCVRRLNRRQRKKLRVEEFQEYVFEVRVWFGQAMADVAHVQFLDAFIEMIESRNLCVGGMGGMLPLEETDGMIGAFGRKSPTVDDQNAVLAWLQQRSEILKVEVGERVDAWHGWGAAN
jgi:uncharacterized protein YggL (DUF469 family)